MSNTYGKRGNRQALDKFIDHDKWAQSGRLMVK